MRIIPRALYIMAAICTICLYGGLAAAGEESKAAPRYLRIGHYQCVCRQGDFEANLKTVIRGLDLGAEAGLAIVCFPESFLTGYFAKEEDARAHSFSTDSPEMERLLRETSRYGSLFMVGFNERRGEALYNTVAVIEKGRLLGTYSKAMPGMYFTPGRDFPVFEKDGLVFGVIICADGGYIEPARILALKGARFIFAPHFNFLTEPLAHYQTVRSDHVARAVENGVYFLRGNNVVPDRQLDGWDRQGYGYGDSYVLNPNGQVVAAAGLYDEYVMIYNVDLDKEYYGRRSNRSEQSASELIELLQQSLKTQNKKAREPVPSESPRPVK